MLCDNDKLAKTSGSPGKTQLLNHFEISSAPTPKANQTGPSSGTIKRTAWYLVDLPGYGFAKVSIKSRNRWEQMIDARHSPQKIDLEFLVQLRTWSVPFCLIFTKSDKENQSVVSKNVKSFLEAMKKNWQFLPQHFVTSAVKKTGKTKILSFIEETNKSLESKAD